MWDKLKEFKGNGGQRKSSNWNTIKKKEAESVFKECLNAYMFKSPAGF